MSIGVQVNISETFFWVYSRMEFLGHGNSVFNFSKGALIFVYLKGTEAGSLSAGSFFKCLSQPGLGQSQEPAT